MGVFDFFLSSDKKAQTKTAPQEETFNFTKSQTANNNTNSNAIGVYSPRSYDDIMAIIDVLALGKPAIVNIKELNGATSQRVIDILSGAIYALHGDISLLSDGLYILTMDGVAVK